MILRLTVLGWVVALEVHRGDQAAVEPAECDRPHHDPPGAGTSLHTGVAPQRWRDTNAQDKTGYQPRDTA